MASCSQGRPLTAWSLTRLADLALGELAVALVRSNVFCDTESYPRAGPRRGPRS